MQVDNRKNILHGQHPKKLEKLLDARSWMVPGIVFFVSVRSSVTKRVNTVFLKQMNNWFWCKFALVVHGREWHGDRCLTSLPPRKIYSCPGSPSPTHSRTFCCILSPSPPRYRTFCPHPHPVTAESCKQQHPIPRRGEDDGYILTLCPYVLRFYLDLCKQFLLSAFWA